MESSKSNISLLAGEGIVKYSQNFDNNELTFEKVSVQIKSSDFKKR